MSEKSASLGCLSHANKSSERADFIEALPPLPPTWKNISNVSPSFTTCGAQMWVSPSSARAWSARCCGAGGSVNVAVDHVAGSSLAAMA
jgi:hypothetical protein